MVEKRRKIVFWVEKIASIKCIVGTQEKKGKIERE